MMNIIHSLTGTGHKDENKDGGVHNDSARDPADHLTGSGTHPGATDSHTGTGVGGITGHTGTQHTGTHGTGPTGSGLPGVGGAPRAPGEGTNLTSNYGHAQDGTYGGNVDNPRPVGGDNTASSNVAGVPASGGPGQHATTGGHPTSGTGGAAGILKQHDHATSGQGMTGHSSAIGTGASTGTGVGSTTHSGSGLGSHADPRHNEHHHTTGGTGIVGGSSATFPGSSGLRSGDDNLGTRLTTHAGEHGAGTGTGAGHTGTHGLSSTGGGHNTGVLSSTTADRTMGSTTGIGGQHSGGLTGTTGSHHAGGLGSTGVADHRHHTSDTALGGSTRGPAQAAGIAAGSAGGHSGSAFGSTSTDASSAERYKEGVVDNGRLGSHGHTGTEHQHGAGHHSGTGMLAGAASAATGTTGTGTGTGIAGAHGVHSGHDQHHLSGLTHGHQTAAPKGADGLFDSNPGVPGGIRGEHKI